MYTPASAKTIVSYADNATPYYPRSVTYNPTYDPTNLEASNFIGFSNGSYADTAVATIDTGGSFSDTQSGLTPGQKYYVQPTGSLSTTPGTPEVSAGLALSSTKIIVKG